MYTMEGNLNVYTNNSDGQFSNQLLFISKIFNVVLYFGLYYIFRRSSDVFVDGAGME